MRWFKNPKVVWWRSTVDGPLLGNNIYITHHTSFFMVIIFICWFTSVALGMNLGGDERYWGGGHAAAVRCIHYLFESVRLIR